VALAEGEGDPVELEEFAAALSKLHSSAMFTVRGAWLGGEQACGPTVPCCAGRDQCSLPAQGPAKPGPALSPAHPFWPCLQVNVRLNPKEVCVEIKVKFTGEEKEKMDYVLPFDGFSFSSLAAGGGLRVPIERMCQR
jgi:hypothetical protein